MAWYSLYKWFIQFRKIPYSDMIKWYKGHLYNTWFESLSYDEREKELERIREKRRIEKGKAKKLIAMTNGMMNYINKVGKERSKGLSFSDLYY